MNAHFSSDECFAAADGTLASHRLAHAHTCESCRQAVEMARAWIAAVAAADVPEPSPLFWNHFSERVQQATRLEVASQRGHASTSWRAWFALGATAAGVVVAVWLVREPGADVFPVTDPSASVVQGVLREDGAGPAWQSVMEMTADWSSDDLDGLTAVLGDGAVLMDELTPTERVAFARLLEQEMGAVQ